VVVLTSGGYGPFTISKSVSIIAASGVHAALTTTLGTGIDITALSTDRIILKNLYVSGLGGNLGINFAGGRSLFMDSVVVDNFADIGMWMRAPSSFVSMTDCTVRRTGNTGIYLDGNDAVASINRSRVEDTNNQGIQVYGAAKATIKDTVVTHVATNGLLVNSGAQATFEDSVSSFNGTGVCAGCYTEAGTARVSNCTITYNTTGLQQLSTGVLETRSNNTVIGNGAETSGTIGGFSPR
jgi:parallel beta helix pectate lyase-like protein